ncbi:MAG: amidase [Pseudomonadota bacterium]
MLWSLSAADAVEKITRGEVSSRDLTTACLDRISETDPAIGAWADLNRDRALAQAEEMDELRRRGKPLGALHGVPVAVKDLFDTKAAPTGWGVPSLKNRQPEADAAVISKLREAGAVILGKTVTTEIAVGATVATRNPHDPNRTSGGSSAGSSAAVAAGQAPLGVGTQTYGSIVRPASFCGVYGFKPSRGLISRRGCILCSETLDQAGVLARTLQDTALLADALMGFDPADAATNDLPKPGTAQGWAQTPPVEPVFAVFDLPYDDRIAPAMMEGIAEVAEKLGAQVERLPAPKSFAAILDHQDAVHGYELVRSIEDNPFLDRSVLSDELAVKIDRGETVSDARYAEAIDFLDASRTFFGEFFMDFDAILTPSAVGEALPMGQGTGDPICSVIWTFAGLPSLSAPWLVGENGMPMGLQIVGGFGEDDRLFRTARWLEDQLSAPQQ